MPSKNKVYMVEIGAYKDDDGKFNQAITFCRTHAYPPTYRVHTNPSPESMARVDTWAWRAANRGDAVIEPYIGPGYAGFTIHVRWYPKGTMETDNGQ